MIVSQGIERQDMEIHQIARLFSAFFEGKIDLPQVRLADIGLMIGRTTGIAHKQGFCVHPRQTGKNFREKNLIRKV